MNRLITSIPIAIIMVLICTSISAIGAEDYKFIVQDYDSNKSEICEKYLSAVIENDTDVSSPSDGRKGIVRLPRGNPGAITFLGEDSFDLAVLTKSGIELISPDGTSRPISLDRNLVNPIAIFSGGNYPDLVVAEAGDEDENSKCTITHFSNIGGDSYCENLSLTIDGIQKIISVGTKNLDKLSLTESGDLTYHHYSGAGYFKSSLPNYGNPIHAALFQDTYDAIVIHDGNVSYINNLGTSKVILTGDFSAAAAESGGNFAVVESGNILHYNIVDGQEVYNEYLSITSGLKQPSAVALRPGSFDRAVADGNTIKFYLWNGTEFMKSKEIGFNALDGLGKYLKRAVLVSRIIIKDKPITHVKLKHGGIDSFPIPGTSNTWVEWYVSTDDDITIKDEELEYNDVDNQAKWRRININNEWYALSEEEQKLSIRLKAVLRTSDGNYTPRILEFITLELREKLDRPKLNVPNIYYTSNPELWWDFSDTDKAGDADLKQSAFQLVLYKEDEGKDAEILNTGKVLSNDNSYTIRNTNTQDSIWGENTNKFKVKVRLWDHVGNESPFTDTKGFTVLAFDKPVITEITSPPMKGLEWIQRFTKNKVLPVSKAGTSITMRIYGIGVSDISNVEIKYPGDTTLDKDNNWSIKDITKEWELRDDVTFSEPFELLENYKSADRINKIWEATFYTSADTKDCPSGTVIAGKFFTDDFSGGNRPLLIMNIWNNDDWGTYSDRWNPFTSGHESDWIMWEGYRWWADGISIINDTVLNDWAVVLKAKDSKD